MTMLTPNFPFLNFSVYLKAMINVTLSTYVVA